VSKDPLTIRREEGDQATELTFAWWKTQSEIFAYLQKKKRKKKKKKESEKRTQIKKKRRSQKESHVAGGSIVHNNLTLSVTSSEVLPIGRVSERNNLI
jgi:hypothetical protein